jgi:ketosteroid isomerase-like protein
MNAQEFRATTKSWFEAINVRDVDTLDKLADKLYTGDSCIHDPGMPDFGRGPAGVKAFVRQLYKDWRVIAMTMEDLFIEGDKTACRITVRGTMAETGAPLCLMVLSISHLVGGQIAEEWELAVPVTEK